MGGGRGPSRGLHAPPLPEALVPRGDDGVVGIVVLVSAAVDARSEVSYAAPV